MLNFKRKNKSIFKLIFFSYVLVLLIPVALDIYSYKKAAISLEQEAMKYSITSLELVSESVSGQFKVVDQIAKGLGLNSVIGRFMKAPYIWDEEQIYEAKMLASEILRYSNISNFAENICIYYKKSQLVIGNNVKYTKSLYYELMLKNLDITDDEWINSLDSFHYKDYMVLYPKNSSESGKIIIYYSLPFYTYDRSEATLVIMVNSSKLKQLLESASIGGERFLCILDSRGKSIIAPSLNEFDSKSIMSQISKDSGIAAYQGKSGKILVSYHKNSDNGWIFLSAVPEKVLMTKVRYLWDIKMLTFFVSLILGLSVIHFAAKRNYKPIQQLIINMCRKTGMGTLVAGNEFMQIEQMFDQTLSSENRLKTVLEKQEHVIEYCYPMAVEYRLIRNVKAGNTKETLEIINELFKKNTEESQSSPETFECLFFDVLCTAIKIIKDSNEISISVEYFSPSYYLTNFKTVEERKEAISIVYTKLCQIIENSRKKMASNDTINKICQYIKENYMDSNLGLVSIAQAVSLTPGYVSKIFKEQTGQFIVEYINHSRLESAKTFLLDDTLRVSDVAARCGYNSNEVFIKVFKKYMGITPGKYKETISD